MRSANTVTNFSKIQATTQFIQYNIQFPTFFTAAKTQFAKRLANDGVSAALTALLPFLLLAFLVVILLAFVAGTCALFLTDR